VLYLEDCLLKTSLIFVIMFLFKEVPATNNHAVF